MISEAVEEVLHMVNKATSHFKNLSGADITIISDIATNTTQTKGKETTAAENAVAALRSDQSASVQQQDWSILWSCFENPFQLLSSGGDLPKGTQEMVCNAVSEMRRYYSRKVVDVLIRIIRTSLDNLKRYFAIEIEDKDNIKSSPPFVVNACLCIPNVLLKPSVDDLQEALTNVGKMIIGIAKGVGQWNTGKDHWVIEILKCVTLLVILNIIFAEYSITKSKRNQQTNGTRRFKISKA